MTMLSVLLLGCATSRVAIQPGLDYQERGEYLRAYQYFKNLTQQHPRRDDLRIHFKTARGLAFRQAVGLAEKALMRDDLDAFLQGMRQARDIQPGEKVDAVVQLVESARLKGRTDAEIREELTGYMREGQKKDLPATLEASAEALGQQVLDGKVHAPVSILGFDAGNGEKEKSSSAYFENALAEALLKKGVKVVERQKMGEIVTEINMSGTGLISPEQMVQAGRLSGAQTIITGNVYLWESAAKYQIRAIDVESSRIVFQETREFLPGETKMLIGK